MSISKRTLAGLPFTLVGPIQPERTDDGRITEITFSPSAGASLHRYGHGPFCRFSIAQEIQWRRGGVYVVVSNDTVRYVGECANLATIWHQVGRIKPSAVRIGGQQTHCRINANILDEVQRGNEVKLWFHPVDDRSQRSSVKAQLSDSCNPPWNLQRARRPSRIYRSPPAQTKLRTAPIPASQISQSASMQPRSVEDGITDKESAFAGLSFSLVGPIRPERDTQGNVVEYMPQSRYENRDNLPLSQYGQGPFCRFSVAKGHSWRRSGVYVLARGDNPLYVGECENLERRWGPMGYGHISPRACFKGGQDTNCRINNLILQGANIAFDLELWFHPVDGDKYDRLAVERKLITSLRPPWNK